MKVKRLIYYCFFVLISLYGLGTSAQEIDSSRFQSAAERPFLPKKVKKVRPHIDHDLRVGVDIHNLILGFISPYRTGLDLSLEYNVKPDISIVLEGGYNFYKKDNKRITYLSQGNYMRLGLDYNLRKSSGKNDHDMYYIGFRYGFSLFEQEVPEYLLLNGYWGNSTEYMASEAGYAHWVEFLTGFKVEILKNWFLGMGIRFKTFIKRSKTGIEPVQFVPGYARNYNSGVMDFNYTIYYNIPLNYKKKKMAVYER